jgi:hypothetical protein
MKKLILSSALVVLIGLSAIACEGGKCSKGDKKCDKKECTKGPKGDKKCSPGECKFEKKGNKDNCNKPCKSETNIKQDKPTETK